MKRNDKNIPVKKNAPAKPGTANRSLPQVKDFTYVEFKKIADKAPFTQSEWAAILHISERTLQRYAKNNGILAPINAERASMIEKLLREGKQTFGTYELFYQWLKRGQESLDGPISIPSLTSFEGIQKVQTELLRIQQGLFA